MYKELGEHNSLVSVLVVRAVNINRSSPIQTTCGGLLCDKQRCANWNDTRGCGCYHMSPDISNIAFEHSVFFSVKKMIVYITRTSLPTSFLHCICHIDYWAAQLLVILGLQTIFGT